MQKERLYQLSADILDTIDATTKPASEILNAFTREHKSLGSKPRRFLTDTVWQALRYKARLNYLMPQASWYDKIVRLETPLPDFSKAPLSVQLEVPAWLIDKIDSPQEELSALLETPEIILRATQNRDKVQALLLQEGIETEPTKLSPYGLILSKRVNLHTLKAFQEGLIEVQDEASQLVALKTNVQPNAVVLDYCAGAGGKTLILAQMMQNKGKIVAHDISKQSLNELQRRVARAHIDIVDVAMDIKRWQQEHTVADFTDVVVDAPCSGTGTWRRCPDARWHLTEDIFTSLLKKQAHILEEASAFVALHGRLSYMTCSLTRAENIEQVQRFLKKHKNFSLKTHCQFSPYRTKTDGLFVAVMERIN